MSQSSSSSSFTNSTSNNNQAAPEPAPAEKDDKEKRMKQQQQQDQEEEWEVYCRRKNYGRTSNTIIQIANLMEHAMTRQLMKRMKHQLDRRRSSAPDDANNKNEDDQWKTLNVYIGLQRSATPVYQSLFDTVLSLNVNVTYMEATTTTTVVVEPKAAANTTRNATTKAKEHEESNNNEKDNIHGGIIRVNIRELFNYDKKRKLYPSCHEEWSAKELHFMEPPGRNNDTNAHPILLTALRPSYDKIQKAANVAMKQQYNITIIQKNDDDITTKVSKNNEGSKEEQLQELRTNDATVDGGGGFTRLVTTTFTNQSNATKENNTSATVVSTRTTETLTIDYLSSSDLVHQRQCLQYVNLAKNNETVDIISVHRRWLEGQCHKFYEKEQFFCFGNHKKYFGNRGHATSSLQNTHSTVAPLEIDNVCEIVYDNITETMDRNGNGTSAIMTILYTDGQKPELDKTFPVRDTNEMILQYWLMSHYSNVHYGNPVSSVDYLIYHWRLGYNMKPTSCYPPLPL